VRSFRTQVRVEPVDPAFPGLSARRHRAVHTESNSPTGNAVHRLDRGPDGSLTPVATYRTGGVGTGASLSSQGAVALSDDGGVLVVVDAGSNDIASFHLARRGHLTLIDRQPPAVSLRTRSTSPMAAFTC
jgi:6-phosphogluconolactonase